MKYLILSVLLTLIGCTQTEYVPVQYVTETVHDTTYVSLDSLLVSLLPSGVGGGISVDSISSTDTAHYIYITRRLYGEDLEYARLGYAVHSFSDTSFITSDVSCYHSGGRYFGSSCSMRYGGSPSYLSVGYKGTDLKEVSIPDTIVVSSSYDSYHLIPHFTAEFHRVSGIVDTITVSNLLGTSIPSAHWDALSETILINF